MRSFILQASRNMTLLLGSLLLLSVSQKALAFDYLTNKPLLFTYQNSTGHWFSCGPVQCNSIGTREQQEAIDLVTHDTHGDLEIIGYFGKCTVYQGDGKLPSYDNQTPRIIQWMKKRC